MERSRHDGERDSRDHAVEVSLPDEEGGHFRPEWGDMGMAVLVPQVKMPAKRFPCLNGECPRKSVVNWPWHGSLPGCRARRRGSGRGVTISPVADLLVDHPIVAQARWRACRRRPDVTQDLPEEFSRVLTDVARFVDPVMEPSRTGLRWNPLAFAWGRAAHGS